MSLVLGFSMLVGSSFAFAEDLDIEAELAEPDTKLLVVEFFATWCKPCMEAVPRWEALRDKYARQGLRLIVVAVKDDAERCTDVPWKPDRIICDTEGALAESFGVGGLPAAFLWNWQGHLLASKVHVDEVEQKIDGWMLQIPRVDIEVALETQKAGVKAGQLRNLVASELNAAGKLVVVASAQERKRLRALARQSLGNFSDERMQCDIGKEVSANNLLQATVTRGARQLRLGLLSAESHCRSRSVYARWDRRNPSRSVTQAVTKLLTSLRRRSLQRPAALQVGLRKKTSGIVVGPDGVVYPPFSYSSPADDDLDAVLADAERREAEAKAARARAEQLQREKREREEKARKARLTTLNERWAKLEKVAIKSVLPTSQRARLLAAFVAEYPTDNPHLETAKAFISRLRSGEEPVSAPKDMVEVPGGEFFMGCNESVDSDCRANEGPGPRKNVERFFIDRTEVTVDAYAECVKAKKCTDYHLDGYEWPGRDFTKSKYCNWGYNDRRNHPINCVDWNQAEAYCEYRGKRLPTEAEWEKAARGTDGQKYPWGNQTATCELAVMDDGGNGCGRKSTWPVDSLPKGASPYGALHMAGNVWEWTADWYGSERKYRVSRGGSWRVGLPAWLRASLRNWYTPSDRYDYLGFRCADS